MIRGLFAGAIALSLLEALVSTPAAAGNAGVLFTAAAATVRRLIDPSVPLVPDLRK